MGLWTNFRQWLANLRRVDKIDYPDMGRSSVERDAISTRLNSAIGAYDLPAQINFDTLALLKKLWVYDPLMSQTISNLVSLANTGHKVKVETANASVAEAAVNRLNEAASRIYPRSAGVDGLISDLLRQAAWSGALSAEDVIDFPARRVAEVVLVPVEQIRFRYVDNQYQPFQRAGWLMAPQSQYGLVELHPETYRYYAVQRFENSPYAKPPFTAAIETLTGPQADIFENIKFVAARLGVLGLLAARVARPPKLANESQPEYEKRATAYLAAVTQALEVSLQKGMAVAYNDVTLDHTSVSGDAAGVNELVSITKRHAAAGLNTHTAFLSDPDSSTETYADVVYRLLVSQAGEFRRLVRRSLERTYRVDLRLGGVPVDGVSLMFNAAEARDPLKVAQAEQSRWQTVKEKVQHGVLTPDEGAHELGHETWADVERIDGLPSAPRSRQSQQFRFSFDSASGRYRFEREVLQLAAGELPANVIPLKKMAV